MRLIPLFPLDIVLFPGVALPLHIFEPRYRLMVKRCLEAGTPFGIVRSERGGLAEIGTVAEIREATRYVDGRWDLVVLGAARFTITRLDREEPYLRGEIETINEPIGAPADEVAAAAERVSELFIDYLDLLRSEEANDEDDEEEDDEGESEADGDVVTPEAIDEAMQEDEASLSSEVVAEIERLLIASNGPTGPTRISDYDEANAEPDGDDDESDELLGSAITRLTGTDDPVGLSHVVSGVVQLSAEQRQALLAAPTALERLRMLKAHLDRENLLLARGIRPWVADPRALRPRRN